MTRVLTLVFLCACGIDPTGSSTPSTTDDPSKDDTSSLEQATTVCGKGPTVKGIDVSQYQGTIDWAKVKGAGVKYAFIRVSDGLGSIDPTFERNWASSRDNGVLHGAYQFFEPGSDPIKQADLLLGKMGTLHADDLPPVLDVEVTGGQSAATIAAGVKKWISHVKAKVGVLPIIYTGFYFWRDSVGAADESASPLFHAQYTSATCPNIAPPWKDWAFWQYTSTGSVAGITGNVDTDRFNGTMADLTKLTIGAQTTPCETIAAAGGMIDDASTCFEAGGPSAYMRAVSDAGEGGGLEWTHATDSPDEANYGQWDLTFETAGRYHVEAYTASAYAQSKKAVYKIHGVTDSEAMLDQSAADGWQSLGDFDFASGAAQFIHLGDNTGELPADNVQLVFDALRFTLASDGGTGSNPDGDDDGDDRSPTHAGCSAGGGGGWGLALVLGAWIRRRRR